MLVGQSIGTAESTWWVDPGHRKLENVKWGLIGYDQLRGLEQNSEAKNEGQRWRAGSREGSWLLPNINSHYIYNHCVFPLSLCHALDSY